MRILALISEFPGAHFWCVFEEADPKLVKDLDEIDSLFKRFKNPPKYAQDKLLNLFFEGRKGKFKHADKITASPFTNTHFDRFVTVACDI